MSTKVRASGSVSTRGDAGAGRRGTSLNRPMLLGDDEPEDERAHELALQTFFLQDDEYSSLHGQWFRTNQEGREQMASAGLEWKKGRWSVQETRILKRNVKAFMKEYSISDISSFVLDSDRSRNRTRQFYQYIGKSIRRPLFSIYRKVLLVFNVQNYVGKWTAEMDQELRRLHEIHGNKWEEIGRHMEMSGRAACDHFRTIKNRTNVGHWTDAEEQRLSGAMAELQREQGGAGDDLPASVRWEDVAAKVGSRNALQCHNKWIMALSWKQTPGRVGAEAKWSGKDDLKLIRVLSTLEEEVEDEEGVDWQELCRDWPAARNVSWLRLRWAALRRDVPHYHVQTMQENLEYLLEHKVPALERHCKE